MALKDAIGAEARRIFPELVALRHRLHEHPEIGLDLPVTQATLIAELDGLGLEISPGSSLTSVVAVLRGAGRASADGTPAVLLRADMDALPVHERTGLPFASRIPGAMHACGHDLHMAMLVGGARLLAAHRDELAGDVVFMFQPGEEGWNGAGAMIDEGVLTAAGPLVGVAYGIHVRSNKTRRGVFTTREGTMMSSSSRLNVTVVGRGGHGSAPHLARDPIVAGADMIGALQTMVTRRFDAFDPVILTVGVVAGGTRNNVIPDEMRFEATIRTFSAENARLVEETTAEICRGIAGAHGVGVELDFVREYPATVNDESETRLLAQTVVDCFGPNAYEPMAAPEPGSEDFSRVLEAVPGSYVMLGAAVDEDPAIAPANHSALARFDDRVLEQGAILHASLAHRALVRLSQGVA